MTIEMVPLNQLTPSQSNVRKTNVAAGIEELAASIEAHGLLQNLTVRAAPKGKFEVVAGGRRLAALTILRRQKKLAKDFPVPCHIIDGADASEISLAENVVRLAMHPADQFIAFKALADQGMGIEDIAGRFGATSAGYGVCLAFRLRYIIEMNAREALHMLELRTSQQGHPEYRHVCQRMHTLIAEQAGHRATAAMMGFTVRKSRFASP